MKQLRAGLIAAGVAAVVAGVARMWASDLRLAFDLGYAKGRADQAEVPTRWEDTRRAGEVLVDGC